MTRLIFLLMDDSVEMWKRVLLSGGRRVISCRLPPPAVDGFAPFVFVGRLSVVSVSAMVHKFKDTKLSSVALKSDKVRPTFGGW